MIKVKEAAKQLNISPRAMYDLAAPEGPIPCHRVGRTGRTVRFEQSDIDSYKQSCRYTTTKNQDAGASRLIASSTENDSALQSFFRKAGLKPKLKPTTKKKRTDSTPLRLVPIRTAHS